MRCIVNTPGKVGSDLAAAQASISTATQTANSAKTTAEGAKTTATQASSTAAQALEMGKKVAAMISAPPVQIVPLSFTGEEQSPSFIYNPSKLSVSGRTSATEQGTYTALFTPQEGYEWEDGTQDPKPVEWTIGRAEVALPTPLPLTFNGGEQPAQWEGFDPAKLSISGDSTGTDAGEYLASFTPTDSYRWADGTYDARTVTWTIARKPLTEAPAQTSSLTYTGEPQSPEWGQADRFDISGILSGTAAGTYQALFSPSANYCWEDGTTAPRTVDWTIQKAQARLQLDSTALTLTGPPGIVNCTWAGTGTISAKPQDTAVCTASVSGSQVTVTPLSPGRTVLTISLSAGKNHKGASGKVQVEVADTTLENNDWKTIARLSKAGLAKALWNVGDAKTVEGSGMKAFILGFDHNPQVEGANTIHFQLGLQDGRLTAIPGVQASTIPDILPADLMALLRDTVKYTGSTPRTVKVWQPSETEVFGQSGNGEVNQTQYDYYKPGNSAQAQADGKNVAWWLRTPGGDGETRCVTEAGAPGHAQSAQPLGCVLAFCL